MSTSDVLSAQSLSLQFGTQRILSDINLSVPKGEFVCIIGPSGCGKTTLLRLFAGLYAPTTGSVNHFGKPFTKPNRDIAIVFQDYSNALLPWRTAAGNVSLALEAGDVPKQDRQAIIADLLGKVGLGQHLDKYPSQMSGGMQQRIQIARCLAQDPTVLLMDEPFGALDAMTRENLQDELLRLNQQTRTATVFVTHDLDEAIYLGDRVIGLLPHPGRVALDLKVDLDKPRHRVKTREQAAFLRMRRELYEFVESAEHAA